MANDAPGTHSLFVFRNNLAMQNSQQATSERPPDERPLIIPRTGTAAPIGAPTMVKKPISPKR